MKENMRENVEEIFRQLVEGEPTSEDIETVVNLGRLTECSSNDPSLGLFVVLCSVVKYLEKMETMMSSIVSQLKQLEQLDEKIAQSASDKIVARHAIVKGRNKFLIEGLIAVVLLLGGGFGGYYAGSFEKSKIINIPEVQLAAANITANALWDAVRDNGNPWYLKKLILSGVNPDMLNSEGETLLLFAVKENASLDVINTLIKVGANIDAMDKSGGTPLWYSIVAMNFEVFSTLVGNGADVNMQYDILGRTPLMEAARAANNPEFINLLVRAGADVSMVDRFYGRTAFDYAKTNSALNGKPEILKLLGEDKRLTEKDIKKK